MHSLTSLLLCALVIAGCSKIVDDKLSEKPMKDSDAGTPAEDAGDGDPDFCSTEFCPAGAADGTNCSTAAFPNRICVDFCCVPRECGDGFADADSGEECDDGNDVEGDGCENDCAFTCTSMDDCEDGDVCNGMRDCDTDTHRCFQIPGMLPPNGSPCTLPGGDGGVLSGMCMSTECVVD